MQLLLKGIVRQQFTVILQGGARKGKVSERSIKHWRSVRLKNISKKKMKTDNEENLDSSRSVAQAKESANSANILNIESISKS